MSEKWQNNLSCYTQERPVSKRQQVLRSSLYHTALKQGVSFKDIVIAQNNSAEQWMGVEGSGCGPI